jgi:hypothetical protein
MNYFLRRFKGITLSCSHKNSENLNIDENKIYVIKQLPEHNPKSLRLLKLTIVTSSRL